MFNTYTKRAAKEEYGNREDMRHLENKQQNGNHKSNPLIIKLQMNGLSTSIKRQTLLAWIKK